MDAKTPAIAPSLQKDNLFYIFRDDGKEVAFEINGGVIRSFLYKLTDSELAYIKSTLT